MPKKRIEKEKSRSKYPIIHTFDQGTPEWDAIRRGKFTASRFSDLFMSQSTRTYQNLINAVVFERIAGETPDQFESEWMKRGIALEEEARQAYEASTFHAVEKIGFVEYSEWIGASPDGFLEKNGIVEIKCPKFSTLIDYHLTKNIPQDYMIQMQGNLMCAGREWADFFVYHPKFPPVLKRVLRDENLIAKIQDRLNEAILLAKKRISIINQKQNDNNRKGTTK
jgi:putative phage-type endonuclease